MNYYKEAITAIILITSMYMCIVNGLVILLEEFTNTSLKARKRGAWILCTLEAIGVSIKNVCIALAGIYSIIQLLRLT